MSMHFEESNNVTLLFNFWNVHGPGGMALSVFVVLLLTVLYELLKVWKITLEKKTQRPSSDPAPSFASSSSCFSPELDRPESISSFANTTSDASLSPRENRASVLVLSPAVNSWLLHGLKTGLHVVQVTLGYMLMLCVMSYNVWIFLGVILGSVLGYWLAFPLLGYVK